MPAMLIIMLVTMMMSMTLLLKMVMSIIILVTMVMSMIMLVKMAMLLRQRSSFLRHPFGRAERHNASPTLLKRPKQSKVKSEWHNGCLTLQRRAETVEKKSQAKRSKAEQGSFTLLQRHSGEKQKEAKSKGEQKRVAQCKSCSAVETYAEQRQVFLLRPQHSKEE